MRDDGELLRSYVEQNSEQAFAELVNRHLGLVYHAALRQTGGNAHCAQDVAQTVFVDLARKAKSLAHRPMLAGWLYTSTRYAASKLARSEQRRQAREEGAQIMNERTPGSSSSADWNQLRPIIDDALHALSERDREAVLLRFFAGKPFAEVGAKLSVSEDAARVRVDRALDKLRTMLSRRGVTSTSIALATLLTNEAMAGAPPGLAVKITGTALAGAAAAGGAAAVGTFLGVAQLQLGLAVCAALGGGGVALQQQSQESALRREITELREQENHLVNLRKEDEQRPLANRASPTQRIQYSPTELSGLRAELASLKDKKEEAAAYQAEVAVRKTRMEKAVLNAPPEEAPYAPILRPSELDERPIPLAMIEPELTPEQRQEGGTATVDFIVDTTGTPRNLRILKSSNPGFGRSALAAVLKWKFRPGVADGKPVSTRMTVPFRMSPEGSETTSAKPETAREEAPYALTMMEPEFSPELRKEAETHGFTATVEFIVDRAGTPVDLVLTNSSSPAFGRSALTAVSKWKFKPRIIDGKSVSTRLTIAFRMPKEEPKGGRTTDPVLSEELLEEEKATNAGYTVTAVIDGTGRPHDLRISKNSYAALGRNAGLPEKKATDSTP